MKNYLHILLRFGGGGGASGRILWDFFSLDP